ncbi:MAG: glycogen synthase, partial [Nocardioidaceae bacterium]
LSKLLYDVPHVVTAHSLEPQRPWKAEQLGGGYRVSSWAERTAFLSADAVIAVSHGMAGDIRQCYPEIPADRVQVIYNGIDSDFYHLDPSTDVLNRLGVDLDRPYVVFVGRITRQKGVPHLLRAGLGFDPSVQLVLLAGAADTTELKAETDAAIARLDQERDGVFVVGEMLGRDSVRQVLSHATAFCCPSIYEPLGIVNLEAMACGTAVVASAVGGIPEVVVDGQTGLLVDYTPHDHQGFEAAFADRVNQLAADPALALRMGQAGRQRVVQHFDWGEVADQTVSLYQSLR